MRGSGNSWCAPVSARSAAGTSVWVGLTAALLFGFAASAQDATPPETTATDEASESATDAADSEQESDTDPTEPSDEELDDLASEPQDPFKIDPFKGSDIEEILIHGEGGTGIPKASPISVIGFDMNTLSKEGIKDIRDLTNFTPGLEIKSAFAASNPAIFIRGVGLDDFNANAASAVAIYQDGVYLQSAAIQLFGFFDQDRVEVLRGPQGTYYRNASAGAIIVQSAGPTQEFESYFETTYGRFNELDFSGAISGPIVPDWLSGRIAGIYNSRDGTTKNRCNHQVAIGRYPCNQASSGDGTTVPPTLPKLLISRGIEDRVNDVENYGLRAQLLLAPPTLDMEWLLNFHGGQNLGHAFQYQHHAIHLKLEDVDPDNPGPAEVELPIFPPWFSGDVDGYRDLDDDPFAGAYDVNGPEKLDIFGTNLKYSWNFGNAYELESLTAYEWHDRHSLENSDGSPRTSLTTLYEDDAWQLSEELNLRGEWTGSDFGDGGWSLGALYLQEDLHVKNYFEITTGKDLDQQYDQKLRNFGSYIQGDYTIRPGCAPIGCDFKLDVGLRYNVEYKKFDITTCAITLSECTVDTISGTESEMWDGWSGDFILSWFYDDEENNVYIAYHRGWKGGHFNGGATSKYDIITGVKPEIVDSYELGLRAHWFDGRLSTNMTGFYYDYQDLQVFKLEQTAQDGFPIAKLVNAQNATIYGVELDLVASPLDGMQITFNFAWVNSEYNEFVTDLPFKTSIERPNGGRVITGEIRLPFDYSGNELVASPEFSFTGSIEYEIPLPGEINGRGLGSITPRYSFSWKDDVYFDPALGQGPYINFPPATFGQEAFWVHNAALSWRSENEMLEVTGWVHNFTDEYYKTNSDDLSIGLSYLLHSWADPRTYGITVTLSF